MQQVKEILIVDDETVINEAIIKICREAGFRADASEDAFLALKKLQKKNYDLILCDIMMPGVDGFQFLEEFKKLNRQTPVIMITGYSTLEFTMQAFSKGAIDFVPKPFTFEELISTVKRGIAFAEIQREIEKSKNSNKLDSIIYVSCPSKYFKLSYFSWANFELEGYVSVGVTDLFLKTIGAPESIKLEEISNGVVQGAPFCEITAKDGLPHRPLSPLSGKIIERNEHLPEEISLLEKDPYFSGWIYRIIPEEINYEKKFLIPCGADRY